MPAMTPLMTDPHTIEVCIPVEKDPTGSEVYRCTHPCCLFHKPFNHQVSLTKHLSRNHEGNSKTLFVCRFCNFKDSDKKKVGGHIRAQHNENTEGNPPMAKTKTSRTKLAPSAKPPPKTRTLTSRAAKRTPSPKPQPHAKPQSVPTEVQAPKAKLPTSTQHSEVEMLEDVPEPIPMFPVSDFESTATVQFQNPKSQESMPTTANPPTRNNDRHARVDDPREVDGGNDLELPTEVSLENTEVWVAKFESCQSGAQLELVVEALTRAVSRQVETPINRNQPTQQRTRQPQPRKPKYDPRAAARIQRLYRRNPKRAFRDIVEGDSQHCHIPKADIQAHFTAVFDACPREETPPPAVVPEWEPLRDPDDSNPLSCPITIDEVVSRLTKCSDTSPGPDGIRYAIWKKVPNGTSIMLALYNAVLRIRYSPDSWMTSTTVLLHKKDDVDDVSNWRPIALSNCLGKLFASIQAYRLINWARRNGRISASQKGFMPYEGCLEHNAVLQDIIRFARRHNLEALVAWLDLRNAFGSAPHSTIFQCLGLAGLSKESVDVVKMLYSRCTTSVRCGNEYTDPIPIKAGVKQGCPLSPIVFNLALEPLIRAIENLQKGFQIHEQSRDVLGYADDLALIASTPEGLQQQLDVASEVADWAGLSFNAKKCASLHIRGKKPGVEPTTFTIQGAEMEATTEDGAYQHLGVPTGYKIHNSATKTIETMKCQLTAIDKSLLAPWQKFNALHTFVLSKLAFHLKAGHVPKKPLNDLDKSIRRIGKKWLNLPKNASPELLYLPYSLGGQNLLPLSQLADACQLTRAVRLLTSNDPTTADLARKTMVDVASKRIRSKATPELTADFFNAVSNDQFKAAYTDVESTWTHLRKATAELKKIINVEWQPCETGYQLSVDGSIAARLTAETQLRSQRCH